MSTGYGISAVIVSANHSMCLSVNHTATALLHLNDDDRRTAHTYVVEARESLENAQRLLVRAETLLETEDHPK